MYCGATRQLGLASQPQPHTDRRNDTKVTRCMENSPPETANIGESSSSGWRFY